MKSQKNDTPLPEIANFNDLSSHFDLPPFLHKDILFMKIEDGENFFGTHSKPLRHRLYAISLILECTGTLNAGFWKTQPQKPTLYIKTPYQVVSWDFDPNVKRKYVIVFSEDFVTEHPSIANLIFEYSFFQLNKAIPFEVEARDVSALTNVFENIGITYSSPSPEQRNILAGYVKILLLHIREMYSQYLPTDRGLADSIRNSHATIACDFFTLIKREILITADRNQDYSVAFFADKLNVHPNHLSTILKKQTGKTAQEHIHRELVGAAKTILVQTDLTMKEISARLCFKDPAHFSNFFKKLEKVTPLQYRNSNRH